MKKDFFIDLFAGAGGVTTGIHMTENAKVIACINHDPNAILSHEANHPDVVHYTEDITTFDLSPLTALVKKIRQDNPGCKIHLWASLECTNFSNAKGGLPRDADSRTLANHLFRYIDPSQGGFDPDHIWIENVREFMAWGPLDEKGRPVSKKNGSDYIRWVNKMQSYGYNFDYRLLCCADYGDYTSRTRYFAQFVRKGKDIAWPAPTHSRKPRTGQSLFAEHLKPWKPVREVLDLDDYGQSIFGRSKPLVDATLERIYAGLVKFVVRGDEQFIIKNYSGKPFQKVSPLDLPAPTITTIPNSSLIKAILIQYNGGKAENNVHNTDGPAVTLTTKDRLGVAQFFTMNYGSGCSSVSIGLPAWAVTTNPKHNLTTVQFLSDMQFNNVGQTIDRPAPTLLASKRYHYLITCCDGQAAIPVYKTDSSIMVKIKEFMATHGIIDICMRMLTIEELKKITGLPAGYVLYGSKTEKKKFIGNAVPTYVVKAMVEAYK